MVVFSPNNFQETSVSEATSIFAVFQSRFLARDEVATNRVNSRSRRFFMGTPLRSIRPFPFLAVPRAYNREPIANSEEDPALARTSRKGRLHRAKRGQSRKITTRKPPGRKMTRLF